VSDTERNLSPPLLFMLYFGAVDSKLTALAYCPGPGEYIFRGAERVDVPKTALPLVSYTKFLATVGMYVPGPGPLFKARGRPFSSSTAAGPFGSGSVP